MSVKYVTRARRTGGGRKEASEMRVEVAERMNCTKSLRNINGQSLHVAPGPLEGLLVKDTNASCRIEVSRWSIDVVSLQKVLSNKVPGRCVNPESVQQVQTFPRKLRTHGLNNGKDKGISGREDAVHNCSQHAVHGPLFRVGPPPATR